ncbi:uncharacterized protein [Macrobrachium rosenbergii]|uniref:uncharacterized protein n=1 Tax=Macrobrachium rosenbergii TaxID=79674 RepID=UPI0034D694BA
MLVGHITGGTWAPPAGSPNRSNHSAGNKVDRPAWLNNRLPTIFSGRNNDELKGGGYTFNDTYEGGGGYTFNDTYEDISKELFTDAYGGFSPNDTANSQDDNSQEFTSRNFELPQEIMRVGKQANGNSYILWRVLKKHPMLKWQPKVLEILSQQMRDFTKIRLFNIKDDPEERNELSTTQVNRLHTMLNYLSRQLRHMVSVPVKRNTRVANPKYWNEVWSPGWCQATF